MLRKYRSGKNNIYDYIMDVKNIIKDTDFSQLYSEERQLFLLVIMPKKKS